MRAGGGSRPSLTASMMSPASGGPKPPARLGAFDREQLGERRASRVFSASRRASPRALRALSPPAERLSNHHPREARTDARSAAPLRASGAHSHAQPQRGEHGEHDAMADVVRSEHDGRLDRVMGEAQK